MNLSNNIKDICTCIYIQDVVIKMNEFGFKWKNIFVICLAFNSVGLIWTTNIFLI